ncbi:MAG: RagB/SusD family nutrient uptake outer membrane protein [Bacteroidetes bacterium]|jgi:hypothetical protein|nr:RagB/SusD family nutrient uptake outer membrane protein [Bacteroidota bacterium]
MKNLLKLFVLASIFLSSCTKNIELYPQSNITTENFYSNTAEIQIALNGCYSSLRSPLLEEWKLTELRSDNTIMGNAASKSVPNRDLSDLDLFIPNTSHQAIYNYWIANYFNIRNINVILNSLNVNYSPSTGALVSDSTTVKITAAEKKAAVAEAAFIRAYHYFNLVRLFGGVFLIHEPVDAFAAIDINRSSEAEIYKLIIADLQYAAANGSALKYASIPVTSLGKVNSWTAKALLAKVYLTLNRKADAIPLLTDIIANSGYGLNAAYGDIFATTNEMNKEILFAVRYKAGGIGQGSPFPNYFAPELSGTAVINGDGSGFNTPTSDLFATYNALDLRRDISIGSYGALKTLYPKKMISPVSIKGDAESDWIVIRYADVLLMLAEAQGNSASSLALINQTRARAGLPALTAAAVTTDAIFANELATERRLEFAFENIRWFDMLRYKTTLPTLDPVATIKNNYSIIFPVHYSKYPSPAPTLATIQSYVTTDKLLLPIPQREIDNNSKLVIPQNPGY